MSEPRLVMAIDRDAVLYYLRHLRGAIDRKAAEAIEAVPLDARGRALKTSDIDRVATRECDSLDVAIGIVRECGPDSVSVYEQVVSASVPPE